MKRRNILIMIAAVAILGLGLSWGRISQAVTEDVKPRIALTFDDGPHPVYTPKLLDGLKERNVKATFFVVGKNIEGREDIIKRMDEEGHLIGNHTYDHVKITGLPEEEACAQITKTSELVKEITGKNTEFVRPPFGAWDKKLECGFEMFPVLGASTRWTGQRKMWMRWFRKYLAGQRRTVSFFCMIITIRLWRQR